MSSDARRKLALTCRRAGQLLTYVGLSFLTISAAPVSAALADQNTEVGPALLIAGVYLSLASSLTLGREMNREGLPTALILNTMLPVWIGLSFGLWRGEQYSQLIQISVIYTMILITMLTPNTLMSSVRRPSLHLLLGIILLATLSLINGALS